jgi:hypothetical protein
MTTSGVARLAAFERSLPRRAGNTGSETSCSQLNGLAGADGLHLAPGADPELDGGKSVDRKNPPSSVARPTVHHHTPSRSRRAPPRLSRSASSAVGRTAATHSTLTSAPESGPSGEVTCPESEPLDWCPAGDAFDGKDRRETAAVPPPEEVSRERRRSESSEMRVPPGEASASAGFRRRFAAAAAARRTSAIVSPTVQVRPWILIGRTAPRPEARRLRPGPP